MEKTSPDAATISEIVEMALSDATSFSAIETVHGINADAVKAIMRANLKPGSYQAWRKRIRQYSERRQN